MEIELTAAVKAVRDELLAPPPRVPTRTSGSRSGPIGLEFTVEFRASTTARAGFKAWLVSADADASLNRGADAHVGR